VGREGDDYIISDPCWHTTLQKISYNDLMKVRFSEGAFKSHGKMYWIKEKPVLADVRPLIKGSIKKTCYNMVGIPISNFGARGILKLSNKIRKLDVKYGEKDAMLYLASLVQGIEEIGTGGAAYRYMYGIFLHEASEMLNEPKLQEYALEMTRIADLWRLFALECVRKFKNRSKASYGDLADMVAEIAAAEKKFFTALKKEKF